MTSKQFTPKAAGKKRGRPAPIVTEQAEDKAEAMTAPQHQEEQASPVATTPKIPKAAELAKQRWADQRKLLEKSGAADGDKLWHPPIAGFVSRWVVDEGGRVDAMKNKGYFEADIKDFPALKGVTHNTDEGSQVSISVMGKDGEPTRQYLMLCDEAIYAQRQSDQETRRQRIEHSIRNAKGDNGLGHERGQDGNSVMYDPSQGSTAFDV
jgi:hypothetical protein